ncbi:hypothetical protein EFV60_15530 [Yersinia enterocolitica]|nr:hypothetical protein [Yersinia enterocolitica]
MLIWPTPVADVVPVILGAPGDPVKKSVLKERLAIKGAFAAGVPSLFVTVNETSNGSELGATNKDAGSNAIGMMIPYLQY